MAQEHYTGQTIEQILELPEEKIDLGIACLVLAKDAYPQIDIARFDYILDYMASRIDRLMQGAVDPESRIGMMNTYLYRSGWWNDSLTFTYDLDDLKGKQKENQFLNGYLSTRTGSCKTMPMLHLVLADRLNWPMKASRSVRHYFLRYVADGFEKNNIDATVVGGYRPDGLYKEEAGISDKAIENGVYLRTLSKKEYIASLLLNQARHFHEREADLDRAVRLLKLALATDPTFASAHWNLGHYYYLMARQLEQEMEEKLTVAKVDFEIYRRTEEDASDLDMRSPGPGELHTIDPDSGMTFPMTGFQTIFPQPFPKPGSTGQPIDVPDSGLVPSRSYSQTELQRTRAAYLSKLEETLQTSRWHRNKARELGIVLKLPDSYYLRQAESIEKFRRTGKY